MPRTFLNKNNIPKDNFGTPEIKIELFGQWDEAMRLFQRMGPEVKRASIAAQLKVCNEIARRVKGHIRNQDLGWPQLSHEYAQRKADAGLSGNILMAYKNYYNNIKVWTSGTRHFVFVGVKKGIYTRTINGKRSRLEVASIAAINEFASGHKIPRRALWNPTIAEMGNSKGIKTIYINSLIWHLRRAGINVTTGSGTTLYINGNKINPFK